MEKYLKMSDQFGMPVYAHKRNSVSTKLMDCDGYEIEGFYNPDYAEYVAHAINSHDELVAMNKELLAVIYGGIESPEALGDIAKSSDWAARYLQCAIDTASVVRNVAEKIKAKAAA